VGGYIGVEKCGTSAWKVVGHDFLTSTNLKKRSLIKLFATRYDPVLSAVSRCVLHAE
jgi:hypothetical protein